jgi:ATP-binding cassette, subfamily C, bacterial EexD
MNRAFFLKHYFIPAAIISLIINMLLLAPSLYMLQVYDRVIGSRSIETLVVMTVLLLLALLMMGALELVRSRLLVKANNALDAVLGPYLLTTMLDSAGTPEASKHAYALRDLASVKGFLGGNGIFAFFDAPWLPIYMGILYLMHPILFWTGLGGAIIMVLLTIINEMTTRRPLEEANTAARLAGRHVEIALRNADTVNAMGMQGWVVSSWAQLNGKALGLQSSASNRAGVVSGASRFCRQALQSLMLGIGAYLVIQDHLSSGIMIAATITFGRAISPIESAIASWKSLVAARSAYARLKEFVASRPEERETILLPAPVGRLSFEGVGFGIRQLNKIILQNITLTMEPGDMVGIVGPNASGKSSLARIVTGVWRPTTGAVRLDGAELDNWMRDDLGLHIGYLPQVVELFPGTVAQNIARLGPPDTDKVFAAARLAGVHEMILRLPGGYEAQVGEGGIVLSGGQRQRIALARALYGSPSLVVLDEPNANLDNDGEAALVQTLIELRKARVTTLVITHQGSLLGQVNKLLVMAEGTMALYGPRDAVMEHMAKQKAGQVTSSMPNPPAKTQEVRAHA